MNNLAIIGNGGFAKEVAAWASRTYVCSFYVEDEYAGNGALPLSKLDTNHKVVIAIGDPKTRRRIAEQLPKETNFATLIHPSVQIIDNKDTYIHKGSIICANAVITNDVVIGEHSQINLGVTIGHNCRIGKFNTMSPSANVSGNVTTDSCVYLGTNSAVIEKANITSNVTIGMGATVIGDVMESGTYVGLVKTKSN